MPRVVSTTLAQYSQRIDGGLVNMDVYIIIRTPIHRFSKKRQGYKRNHRRYKKHLVLDRRETHLDLSSRKPDLRHEFE